MFYYCDECRIRYGWPESPCKARGQCSMCGQTPPRLHRVSSKKSLSMPKEGWEREEPKIPQKELE